MHAHPDIAGQVLRLEYRAMSLNPNARLYGKKSLRSADSGNGPRGAPYVDSGTGGSCAGWARPLLALGAAQDQHVEWLRGRPGLATGPKGGELFGYHTVPRYLDNTTFTQLLRGHLRLQDRSRRELVIGARHLEFVSPLDLAAVARSPTLTR
ncbi:hypothetical protein OHB41_42805 [Streptomyces sp. NBC_01571]|uniref:hypothetical protein n=1 Tax=Streptomyces sp. NBC_01571 TaxID=2975883 RepID=UPI00224F68E4|nr:hypothetical protein [Streptomyces sp. NBC_01571]MCX4579797.1 hypothetical protein [Streptomyces sp. NBC_01571]